MENNIDIIKLPWNQAIRQRSGMYIGDTRTPSVLLREAIDNSIDELYGSEKTNRIYISTLGDWKVVADNGRGIPILWDEEYKMTKTELAVTSTHTGSKFNKNDVAIGLNGVGLSATNALSSDFVILSKITDGNARTSIPDVEALYNQMVDDGYYFIHFSKGEKINEGAIRYEDVESQLGFSFPNGMSTITAFIPDDTIFETLDCKVPKKNLSYVISILKKIYHRLVSIEVDGKLIEDEFTPYKFEFIKEVKGRDYYGKSRKATFYINFDVDKNLLSNEFTGSINSLVTDRGVHLDAAKLAYQTAIKSQYNLTYDSVMAGLKMNVIVVAVEVDFSSQTKERCTKIEGMYYSDIARELVNDFRKIFKNNKDFFDDHIERLNEYIAATVKLSTINKVKAAIGTISSGARSRSKVPKEVKDAYIKDRKQAELFIVEGKSASGSILNNRDSRTQAVFELKGVPMNAIDKDLDDILDNEEMKGLISAIGVGVNEYHEVDKARYGKIIISADADPDGLRISALMLGIIAKKMTFLIKRGMVYVLRSPLYIQNGNFIYPEDDNLLDRSKPYSRIKGLGELDDDEVRTVITNDKTRKLFQVTLENMDEALQILTMTSYRKQLMIDEEVVTDPYNLGLWY